MPKKPYLTLTLFVLTLLFLCKLSAKVEEYDASTRFTLEKENSTSPIVYYFSTPDTADKPYPILVLCEGSTSKGHIGSVLFIRNYLAPKIKPLQVGYLTIEKQGVDGNEVNEEEFWRNYTRSQRLKDHLSVIRHLEENPPTNWNGKFIFIGASEGGPLVTDLSILCPNTLATINWVGASDFSWKEELWLFFQNLKEHSFWFRLYDTIPRWLPFSSDVPSAREEYDTLVEKIIQNPSPNEWMGGMTYLYHADAFQTLAVDYSKIHAPFLVVKGSLDSDIASSDAFVQKAKEANAPITYFRIADMDHWIRKRPDVIDLSFDWLKKQMTNREN